MKSLSVGLIPQFMRLHLNIMKMTRQHVVLSTTRDAHSQDSGIVTMSVGSQESKLHFEGLFAVRFF